MEFVEEEAAAGFVGLEPLAVDYQLGDGALADAAEDLSRSGGVTVDVDLGVRDAVLIEELAGLAAIPAPGGTVKLHFHGGILRRSGWYYQ